MTIQTRSDPHIVIIDDEDDERYHHHHHQQSQSNEDEEGLINLIAGDLSLLEAASVMGRGGVVPTRFEHEDEDTHTDGHDDDDDFFDSSYRSANSDASSNLSLCIDIDFPQQRPNRRIRERRPSQDRLDELHQEVQRLLAARRAAEANAAAAQQQQQQEQELVSTRKNSTSTTRTRLMNFINGEGDDNLDDDSFRINQRRIPRSSRRMRKEDEEDEDHLLENQHQQEQKDDHDDHDDHDDEIDDDDFYGVVEIYHLDSDNTLIPISHQEPLSSSSSSSPKLSPVAPSGVPIMQQLQEASSEIMPRAA